MWPRYPEVLPNIIGMISYAWNTRQTKKHLLILTLILKAMYYNLHYWLEHKILEFAVRTEKKWTVISIWKRDLSCITERQEDNTGTRAG